VLNSAGIQKPSRLKKGKHQESAEVIQERKHPRARPQERKLEEDVKIQWSKHQVMEGVSRGAQAFSRAKNFKSLGHSLLSAPAEAQPSSPWDSQGTAQAPFRHRFRHSFIGYSQAFIHSFRAQIRAAFNSHRVQLHRHSLG
jgi:hypothetical protein